MPILVGIGLYNKLSQITHGFLLGMYIQEHDEEMIKVIKEGLMKVVIKEDSN